MFRVGDRVRIVTGPWASDCGYVVKVRRHVLSIDTDSGCRGALVHPSHVELVRSPGRKKCPGAVDYVVKND